MIRNLLCRIFGHKMYFDTSDVGGSSTCKRCPHTEPGINWNNKCPPMPKHLVEEFKRYEALKIKYEGFISKDAVRVGVIDALEDEFLQLLGNYPQAIVSRVKRAVERQVGQTELEDIVMEQLSVFVKTTKLRIAEGLRNA